MSNPYEVQGVSMLTVAGVLLRDTVMVCLVKEQLPYRSKLVLDFLLLITPLLLGFTMLSPHWPALLATTLTIPLIIAVRHIKSLMSKILPKYSENPVYHHLMNTPVSVRNRPMVTNFRAYILLSTVIAILAVDFQVFPRKFSKTLFYGTQLMDVGVGCFVFISNAMVSPEARGKTDHSRTLNDKLHSIKKAVVSSSALLLLGFVRLASIQILRYQIHNSEYGIHWNFFFTLAAVKILSTLFYLVIHPRHSWIPTLIIAATYQLCLSKYNLTNILFYGIGMGGNRVGVFNANREGILSCIGYLALYFAGVQFGRHIFIKKREKLHEWLRLLLELIAMIIISAIALHFSHVHVQRVSRKMANLSFIVWIIMYNIALGAAFLAEDLLFVVIRTYRNMTKDVSKDEEHKLHTDSSSEEANQTFCLLRATNYNGLGYFLVANLLTGCVNFSMSTRGANKPTAMLVLSTYMLTLSLLFSELYRRRVFTKVW